MSKKGGVITEGKIHGRKIQIVENPVDVKGALERPRTLKSIKEVRLEMARIYRAIFDGKLTIQQAGSLIFMLDKLVKAIKGQIAVDTAAQAYMQSWAGFSIVAPSDADAKAIEPPRQEIIPPKKKEESEDEQD